MAGEQGDREELAQDAQDQAEASHEPRECMACRGTGQVISHLGGTTSRVSCPWCGGGGLRLADVDAQARWREGEAHGAEADEPPEPGA